LPFRSYFEILFLPIFYFTHQRPKYAIGPASYFADMSFECIREYENEIQAETNNKVLSNQQPLESPTTGKSKSAT